jgi:hypothetical protein
MSKKQAASLGLIFGKPVSKGGTAPMANKREKILMWVMFISVVVCLGSAFFMATSDFTCKCEETRKIRQAEKMQDKP